VVFSHLIASEATISQSTLIPPKHMNSYGPDINDLSDKLHSPE
jgi:hypothetical protein